MFYRLLHPLWETSSLRIEDKISSLKPIIHVRLVPRFTAVPYSCGLHIAVSLTNKTLELISFHGRKVGVCVVTMFKVSTVLGGAHCEAAS
jgi:hypothetical protein